MLRKSFFLLTFFMGLIFPYSAILAQQSTVYLRDLLELQPLHKFGKDKSELRISPKPWLKMDREQESLEALGWVTILQEGFETSWPTSGWSVYDYDGSTNGEYYWGRTNYKAYQGSYSIWCARSGANGMDPATSNYPNYSKSIAVYGPFDLSDATRAELSFRYWLNTEINYDWFGWAAGHTNNILEMNGPARSGNSGGWISGYLDLTNVPTIGNLTGDATVYIAFMFLSDGSVSYKGAFIDEILLKKYTANQPPVLTPIGNKTVDEGQLLEFTVSASDPENDPLTYSASNLPPGATFVGQRFSWTPNYTQSGVYSNVHFEVSDGSQKDTEDIAITVNNVNRSPATFSLISPANGDTVRTLTPTLVWRRSTDPDPGDTISYTVFYATDSSFAQQDSLGGIADTTVSLSGLSEATRYFWKVKAVDPWAARTWSLQTNWSFYVQYSPLTTQLTLASGLRGSSGASVQVPIKVSTPAQVALAQFVVEYDSTVLRYDSTGVGPDAPGFSVSNVNSYLPFAPSAAGTNKNILVQLSGGGTNAFTGHNRSVALLSFTIVGSTGATSALTFDRDSAHTNLTASDASPVTISTYSDGSFTVGGPSATVSLPSGLRVSSRSMVQVPIKVSTTAQVAIAQFVAEYDSTVLRYESTAVGSDASGFSVSNVNTHLPFAPTASGANKNVLIQLSGGGTNAFSGDNRSVAVLNFTVVSSAGRTTPLAFDRDPAHTNLTASDGSVVDIADFIDGRLDVVTSVAARTDNFPTEFRLMPNYPNPFNPETVIQYQLPQQAEVRLEIYNILRKLVRTLVDEKQPAGYYTVRWNGKDDHGRPVASGVYLYSLKAGEFVQVRKMLLVR